MSSFIHRTFLGAFASLAFLCAVPADAFATYSPGLSAPSVVIVPPAPGTPPQVARQWKTKVPLNGTFRQRLQAWRLLRSLLRTGADDGKADRLAKRSLTFGIISMSALLLAWVPVVGAILLLGSVPMGVLAIVDGLKARRLGSEKSAGLVLGIVSVSLFVLLMILALLILVGVLVFLGG